MGDYKAILKQIGLKALQTVKELEKAGIKPISIVDKMKAGN